MPSLAQQPRHAFVAPAAMPGTVNQNEGCHDRPLAIHLGVEQRMSRALSCHRTRNDLSAFWRKADFRMPSARTAVTAAKCREVPKGDIRVSLFDHLVGAGEQWKGKVRPSVLVVLRLITN